MEKKEEEFWILRSAIASTSHLKMFGLEWRETTAYLPKSPIIVVKKGQCLILKLNFQKVDSIFF